MICLSFDTDHMSEERMKEFLELFDLPGDCTFFCTQRYDCLEETDHETCPHPFLKEGADWQQELIAKRVEFPQAIGWRSHSCVYSHLLASWLGSNEYQYVSIHDDFGKCGLEPMKQAWGVWSIPIYYMDTLDFSAKKHWGESAAAPFARELLIHSVTKDGLYVYDFHPIHLLLNTPNPDYYFKMRDRFRAHETIEHLSYDGYGTANFFHDLVKLMKERKLTSVKMRDFINHGQSLTNETAKTLETVR